MRGAAALSAAAALLPRPAAAVGGVQVPPVLPVLAPPGEETALLVCGDVELRGRARAGAGAARGGAPHFDLFRVRVGGADAVVVERGDPALLFPSGDDDVDAARGEGRWQLQEEKPGPADGGVAVLAPAQLLREHATLLLGQARAAQAPSPPAAPRLTSIRVAVGGASAPSAAVPTAADAAAGDGRVAVKVSRDPDRRLGSGYVEAVAITTEHVSMVIQSSLALDRDNEVDRLRHMHLDMSFPLVDYAACSGALPEMWGTGPARG